MTAFATVASRHAGARQVRTQTQPGSGSDLPQYRQGARRSLPSSTMLLRSEVSWVAAVASGHRVPGEEQQRHGFDVRGCRGVLLWASEFAVGHRAPPVTGAAGVTRTSASRQRGDPGSGEAGEGENRRGTAVKPVTVGRRARQGNAAAGGTAVSSTGSGAGAGGCAAGAVELVQPALTATYWFDSADPPEADGAPYTTSIRFFGRRVGGTGRPGDRFDQVETVCGVVPGSGPISVTTRVGGVNPGDWMVGAKAVSRKGQVRVRTRPGPPPTRPLNPHRLLWSLGNPVMPIESGTRVHTHRSLALAGAPGIVPGSWLALVAVGVLVALGLQAILAARAHLDVGAALTVSIVACLLGAVGARVYFVVLYRGRVQGLPTQGLCVQGFILGTAVALPVGLVIAALPIGAVLNLITPGLFFGMAIGRQGCFFTGCCLGRPTASRWGIWASDRRVGSRRCPTQQLESLACLIIGVVSLILVLRLPRIGAGTVLIGALAGYTLLRQVLFPFRAEPRQSSLGRPATMAAASLVLIADIVVSVL